MNNFSDEPLSPAGRMMVQPGLSSVIYSAVGLKNPVDMDTVKSTVQNSLFVTHPRFRSLLFRDKNGREYWRPTEVNLDNHIIVAKQPDISDDPEKIANEYVADLMLGPPLSHDKPLWEIHLLDKCVVFRIHHAIGDGMSLMSMLLSTCRKAEDPESPPTLAVRSSRPPENKRKMNLVEILIEFIKTVFFALIYNLDFMMRLFWISDRKTAISGGEGVELWPRKIVNAQFLIKNMKMVKEAVGDATINDVLVGVVTAGLSRYLDHRSPKSMKDGQRITGAAMVNLREQQGLQDVGDMMKKGSKCRWGNEVGTVLVPIYYTKNIEPLQYVKNAKQYSTEMKKIGPLVKLSRQLLDVLTFFVGPTTISKIGYKLLCNTTFVLTNVMGPQEEITIAGSPIMFIRVNLSANPLALTMAMVSYNGKADMQIAVAKDIIPDPEFLAKCFEDCLVEMTEAAACT